LEEEEDDLLKGFNAENVKWKEDVDFAGVSHTLGIELPARALSSVIGP